MFPSASQELNLQPVSFLISSISSSLSNVDALDPMVKCSQVLKPADSLPALLNRSSCDKLSAQYSS